MNTASYPMTRLRRMRRDPFSRALVRESIVTTSDLICPIYLLDGSNQRQPVPSMPGISRLSIDLALEVAAECVDLGIPAVSLHAIIDNVLRTREAAEAINPDGLLPRAITSVKARFPQLGVISELSLSPYTSAGQIGLVSSNGHIMNDESVEMLTQQALNHARAGADILMLSDALDGYVAAVRSSLESRGFPHTRVMASSANFASAFFGPYGDLPSSIAASNKTDPNTCQLDPANTGDALRKASTDLDEGADIILVKPGMAYLDVIRRVKDELKVPTFAFQVSGEYAMLKAAAQNGWVLHDRVMMETILCFKRAGADAVLTFFARDIARLLQQTPE